MYPDAEGLGVVRRAHQLRPCARVSVSERERERNGEGESGRERERDGDR